VTVAGSVLARLGTPLLALFAALTLTFLACGGTSGEDSNAREAFETQPVPARAADETEAIDRADVDYVGALCLIGTRLTAEGREEAAKWGVAFETWGEDISAIPHDRLGEFAAEAHVGPFRNHQAALEGISAPSGVEEFHAAAVSHRVERILALDALLQLFPSEGSSEGPSTLQAYSRLLAGIGEISVNAPGASVELRRRLFAAARETPRCADTDFLSVFLGGGEPTSKPSKADEEYLRELCSGGLVFGASLVDLLPGLSSRLDDEARARLVSDLIDSMEELLAALSATSPPDDIAVFHLEYMDLLREGIVFFGSALEQVEEGGDPAESDGAWEQFVRVQRLFGSEGEPTPPPAVRKRLLESANSVEECSGTSFFMYVFLGTDEE